MKHYFALMLLLCLAAPSFATVRYVKIGGSDAAAGTSWASAYATLQKALSVAVATDQIWVAAGTYYPDEGGGQTNNDRFANFVMKNGVAIYGGFAGTETSLSERILAPLPGAGGASILSGDIDQNDTPNFSNSDSNSYHVIANNNNGVNNTAILDGFTISGGNANGYDNKVGGGMYNYSTSPSVRNCNFLGNQALIGGGMNNKFYSSPILSNCNFSGNLASSGGGMNNDVYASPSLSNCSFSGNQATQGGGMSNFSYCSPSLLNCSFSGNQATNGGGMRNEYNSSASLKNCILWGNSSEIYNNNGGSSTYASCLVQGLNPSGTGNLDGMLAANNPLFVSQPPIGVGTTGDLRLRPCSPAINAGDNDNFTNADKDLDGNPRIVNTTVDLGAYEVQSSTSNLILYVKTNGDDTKNGQTWANAYATLQKALQHACVTDQIWVAAGTYYPDEGGGQTNNNRYANFIMKNGVAIYGGFAGTETSLSERILGGGAASILSGDIDQNDTPNFGNRSVNSFHVIANENNGLNNTAILDGFTISGGNANDLLENSGGGMINVNSSPSLSNCSFSGNWSGGIGGSVGGGGGMSNGFSSPSLSNCSFSGNWAAQGGGMYNGYSSPSLSNCSFSGNKADVGGGLTINNSSPNLINCTFSGNSALYWGGAVFVTSQIFIPNISTPSFSNCIFWGNSSEVVSQPADIIVIVESHPILNYCIVQGGWAGIGANNLNVNPLFVSQPPIGLGTTGNLRLSACSPAINVGDNAASSTTTDLAGNTRKFGVIDLGAYEFQSVQIAASAGTTTPVVCVGKNISLTASGGDTFWWNGPSGSNFSSTAQNPSFMSSSTSFSGLYTVFVSNASCTLTATATVSVQVNPNASINTQPANQTLTERVNLTLSVVASNATTYQWQKNNVNFGSSSASPSLNLGAATLGMSGTYKVIVSGACGTATSSAAMVTVTPSASFATSNEPVCIGLVIDLKCQNTGTGYTWLGPDGWTSNLKNPSRGNATAAMGGVYSVSVKSGSVVSSATTSVQMVTKNAVSASSNSPVSVGNAIQLSANGGLAFSKTYQWTGPSSFSSTLQTPTRSNAQLSHKGKYIVTFNGACGTATASTSVVVNAATRIASENIEEIDLQINAYPNPVTNTLTVEVTLQKPSALHLTLFNSIGNESGEWQLAEESMYHKTELDLSALMGGMYLLQAQAGKQKVVKRVVKIQH